MGKKQEAKKVLLGPAPELTHQFIPMVPNGSAEVRGHPGLVFDRYLPVWEEKKDRHGRIKDPYAYGLAGEVLQGFSDALGEGTPEQKELLAAVLSRQSRLMEKRKGVSKTYSLRSALIEGLGLSHPTGNGFLFDPVVGVPWLPGTAVKGLCRQGAGLKGATEKEVLRLLGPEPESEMPDTGALVFLDAWPTQWPSLQVQVMTPHYSSYYSAMREDKRKRRRFWDDPHGLDDPVPIHFLSVAENTDYGFGILPRTGGEDGIETAFEWLEYALELLGAGGKTAVGFGVFTPAK